MNDKNYISRLHVMLTVCAFLFVVLWGRMLYLQLWKTDYYAQQSDGNRLRTSKLAAPRGLIYDCRGKELVNNLPTYVVALQKQGKYDEKHLEKLSSLLQMPVSEIKEKIKEKANLYEPVVLKSNLTMKMLTQVEEECRDMPEVMIEVKPVRNYLHHELAVHALGYVGEVSEYEIDQGLFKNTTAGSIVGKAGLEKKYDQVLRGTDGSLMDEVDASGNVVQHYEGQKPVPGKSLKLTIDYRLQKTLEDFTDQHLANLRAQGIDARAAAVVALDPRTGAVKAMLSRPGYDPNWFVNGISSKNWNMINNDEAAPMNNKVIMGAYPPGSTFKIVTGSAAFELKKVTMDEMYYDGGTHPLVPTMRNAGGEVLGWLNFVSALAMSDNVYFYEMGRRVGIDNIEKYARIYGFGKKTGIDLEGEAEGEVASKAVKKELWDDDWRLGDTFNAAIGQGFNLATPLQLAVMLSCVANNGIKNTPYLVDKVLNTDGSVAEQFQHAKGKRIAISEETMDNIREGMAATTQEGGTASYFSGLPRAIAGKTGTAENSQGRDHGLFVAYGPVDDPQLVVVCIVEQGGYGSTAAGPIVYKAFEEFFQEKGWMERPQTKKKE